MLLKHLPLGGCGENMIIYESYILHAESLGLVWRKYESYILNTSAVMYTFQNLNTAVNDKV